MTQPSSAPALPDQLRVLAEHAPKVMEAYQGLRKTIFTSPSGGAIPALYQELMTTALDILQRNELGVEVHTRNALAAGASMEQVTETVALAILVGGMSPYLSHGYKAIEIAESVLKGGKSS